MSARHVALALVVVVIWGVNFVVMKVGLEVLPPLFFSFLRFAFSALPLVLFVKRPAVPWRLLWCYALAQFGGVTQRINLYHGPQRILRDRLLGQESRGAALVRRACGRQPL